MKHELERIGLKIASWQLAAFDEEQHPRADDGKFTDGDGGIAPAKSGKIEHEVFVDGKLHKSFPTKKAAHEEGARLRKEGKANVYMFPSNSPFKPKQFLK